MAWLNSRRNQMLLGGCVGAGVGGLFAHGTASGQAAVVVIVCFALGQALAVVMAMLWPAVRSTGESKSVRSEG